MLVVRSVEQCVEETRILENLVTPTDGIELFVHVLEGGRNHRDAELVAIFAHA
jgi:hypothetical protein